MLLYYLRCVYLDNTAKTSPPLPWSLKEFPVKFCVVFSYAKSKKILNRVSSGIINDIFLYLVGILITYIMCYWYVPNMRTDRYKDT